MNQLWTNPFSRAINDVEILLESYCYYDNGECLRNMMQLATDGYEDFGWLIEEKIEEKKDKVYQLKRLTDRFMY